MIKKLIKYLMSIDSFKKEITDLLYNKIISESSDNIMKKIIDEVEIKANNTLINEMESIRKMVTYYKIKPFHNKKLDFFSAINVLRLTNIDFNYTVVFPLGLTKFKYFGCKSIKEFYDQLLDKVNINDEAIGVRSVYISYKFELYNEQHNGEDKIIDSSNMITIQDFKTLLYTLKDKLEKTYPEYLI